jgi:hypothetical protein
MAAAAAAAAVASVLLLPPLPLNSLEGWWERKSGRGETAAAPEGK